MKMHFKKFGIHTRRCSVLIWVVDFVALKATAYVTKSSLLVKCVVLQFISCIQLAPWEREGGPNTYLPARDHSWRAGESGRVRKGVEAIVSLLNRKLHNICSLAYREGLNGQLCVAECVFMHNVLYPGRQCDIPLYFPNPWHLKATVWHYSEFPLLLTRVYSLRIQWRKN